MTLASVADGVAVGMATLIGSYSLIRKRKAANHPSAAKRPFEPNWLVRFRMPGEEPKDKTAKLYPVCAKCLAVEGDPVKERPNCGQKSGDCQTGARRWAESELAVMTEAMRRGDMEKKQEWLKPKRHARLSEVLELFGLRGPNDRKQRLNCLKSFWMQTTGRPMGEMDWADLTPNLFRDWAELRQEAGRRGWLGLGRGKNMPEGGWAALRALQAGRVPGERLPALDTRTAAPWNTTILSYLTSIKTIFGEESRDNYLRSLELPPLTEFLKLSLDLPTPKGHKAMTSAQLLAILHEADKMRTTNPRLWVVNQMLMRLACRPEEVEAARPSWLEKVGGRTRIAIINREDEGFTLKAGSNATERRIYLPDDLVAAMHEVMTETSLIGAKHKTEAHDMIYVEHSKELRKWAKLKGAQTNYLLRHLGAAERMTSQDAGAAAALLGHSSDKLIKSTYGKDFGTLEPLGDEEILRRFGEE